MTTSTWFSSCWTRVSAHPPAGIVPVSARRRDGAIQRAVAQRHGISPRTLRRRRGRVVDRLREARADYLAGCAPDTAPWLGGARAAVEL